MIKSYVITITEIDDSALALEELSEQLSAISLLKNTVGIVSVSIDYLETGVYEAVAKAAPFPVLGLSTYGQNADGNISVYLFSILVLTSDDCEFAHGYSDIIPSQGDVDELIKKLYQKCNRDLEDRAKIAFLYAPMMTFQFSFNYLEAIAKLDKALPVFGSLASCEAMKIMDESRTVYNAQIFDNQLVMLLISGNVAPSFYLGSLTKESIIIPHFGEVTAAKDNAVMEINHQKVNDVFEKIGLKDGAIKDEGSLSLSILAEEKDSSGNLTSSAVRGLLAMEEGVAVFGGRIPVGAVLSAAISTKEVIAQTAREVVKQIKAEHSDKTILLYSCLGRQISLLDEPMMEYEIIDDELRDSSFRYVAAVSGGELCPVSVTETKAENSEHNQTLIACVL